MKVNFHMERLSVSIKDKEDKNEIIRLTVGELNSMLTQRPGAQAIKFVFTFLLFGWSSLALIVVGVLFKSLVSSANSCFSFNLIKEIVQEKPTCLCLIKMLRKKTINKIEKTVITKLPSEPIEAVCGFILNQLENALKQISVVEICFPMPTCRVERL